MFIHVNHICAKNGSGTGTFLEFPEVLLTTAMILFNGECKVYVLLLFRYLGGITHLRKAQGHLKATAGKVYFKKGTLWKIHRIASPSTLQSLSYTFVSRVFPMNISCYEWNKSFDLSSCAFSPSMVEVESLRITGWQLARGAATTIGLTWYTVLIQWPYVIMGSQHTFWLRVNIAFIVEASPATYSLLNFLTCIYIHISYHMFNTLMCKK